MNAKDYLMQIKYLEQRIQLKQEEITQLRTLATSITAPTDREAVQTSGTTDKVGELVVKIVDLRYEINDIIDKLIDTKRECIEVIEQIEIPLQYAVLHKFYIDNKPLPVIASELHYSYEHIKRIHRKALQNVEKILQKVKDATE